MQKKLIALAVAGLVSAPVFAQSNVSIYGIADAYMGFGSHGDNDYAGVDQGGLFGSRIGFRGTEDLGNGLKAVFTLEQGINIDNGTGLGGASRQSFVGLAGAFGAVTLGRQYAPGWDFQYDAFAGSIVSPQYLLSSGVDSSISPTGATRWDNSVAYNGMFSGLKVRAIYSMAGNENTNWTGTNWADPSDDDAMGLGLEYANGPLKVGAVYQVLQTASNAVTADDQTEWLLGGSYNFGVATLALSYQDAEGLNKLKGQDAKLWQVGVIVPVGAAGNVHLGYGEVKHDDAFGLNTKSAKSKSYSVAYTHALSKRTTAYTGYNRTDNDTGLALGPIADLDKSGLRNGGENSDLFVFGVNHTF
jgi:predicted porin